jgi:hypothetical protein
MKKYWGKEVHLHAFLILALYGRERTSVFRADLDTVMKKKFFPLPGIKLGLIARRLSVY